MVRAYEMSGIPAGRHQKRTRATMTQQRRRSIRLRSHRSLRQPHLLTDVDNQSDDKPPALLVAWPHVARPASCSFQRLDTGRVETSALID